MSLVLDARNPLQVSSARVVDADLGVHDRHLLVISGIAIVNWTIDTDETQTQEIKVRLAVYGRELEQASPFVGLGEHWSG